MSVCDIGKENGWLRALGSVAAFVLIVGGLSTAGSGVSRAQSGGGGHRGYVDGGNLVSHGVEPSSSAGLFSGIERGASDAAATARGRASVTAAGLEVRVKGKEKPEKFASPDAAVAALMEALRADDPQRLEAIFGVQQELISSGDPVADRALRQRFLQAYENRHSLGGVEAGMVTLTVGQNEWPFAVPIVESKEGFYFNAAAGANEVVFRRVGRNELAAIEVCREYVGAQEEYASVGHDGQPPGQYAQKLMSDTGKQNGLYWPVREDQLRSPAGPLLASAQSEGYSAATAGRSTPYHGYLYVPLRKQNANASGGAKNYIDDKGTQTGGFALLAYPADYGRSGVKSFMVNQDGVVFEKDLGKRTPEVAPRITEFDPKGWSPVR